VVIRFVVCTSSTTAVGFAIGTALGVPLAWVSWGHSFGVGAAVGTVAGLLAGVLAVADPSGRFGGGGQWVGAGVGILALGALVAHAATHGPGWSSPAAGDLFGLAAAAVFALVVGALCGRVCERVGRAVADT